MTMTTRVHDSVHNIRDSVQLANGAILKIMSAGADDAGVRRRLLEEYGIEIGAGLGPMAGKAWRIGLVDPANSADNAPALSHIVLSNQAVATSGPSARGELAVSPLTGARVNHVAYATAVADSAAQADALADLGTLMQDLLAENPGEVFLIEGHTDAHGGDDMNQKLSQERAESVRQYMINAMRIPTYRLIATGYGETRPVASNETEAGRARNRRIDIVIRPNLDPT